MNEQNTFEVFKLNKKIILLRRPFVRHHSFGSKA